MEGITPFFFQKETRLSCDASRQASTVTIDLPGTRSSNRANNYELPKASDEKSFAALHLASSASIYISKHVAPSAILWRLLDGGKTLSLQTIDLQTPQSRSKQHVDTADNDLVVRLRFPAAILPSGVAFTEASQNETIQLFVLTTGNVLYTLHLKDTLLSKPQTAEGNIGSWVKSFSPASFHFRYPHRLTIIAENELLLPLHDGGILKLSRSPGDDGSSWTESILNDSGWKGYLTFLPWQGKNAAKYGSFGLSWNTSISLAISPSRSHLHTVNLNHTLKTWNLMNGQIEHECDLLNEQRKPEDAQKYQLDPSRTHLLEIVERSRRVGDLYYVITYSPIGAGQFKFWVARNDEQNRVILVDMFAEEVFEPHAPSAEIWTLSDFRVSEVDTSTRELVLLWKRNANTCVRALTFDILDVGKNWNGPWLETIMDKSNDDPNPDSSSFELEDPSSRWTAYFFNPGRFTSSTLETSLAIYDNISALKERAPSNADKGLQEKLCQSIGSHVVLSYTENALPDYTKFSQDTELQWLRFYRIAADLEKKRREAISIIVDDFSRQSWLVTADGVSMIRELGEIEVLHFNALSTTDGKPFKTLCKARKLFQKADIEAHHIGVILDCVDRFHKAFLSDNLLYSSKRAVMHEVFQEPSTFIAARIDSFYERCNFREEIADDEVNSLISDMKQKGYFNSFTPPSISSLCIRLSQWPHNSGEGRMTIFGARVLNTAATDVLRFNSSTLFKILIFLVFLSVEEREDFYSSHGSEEMFTTVIDSVKSHQFFDWLSQNSVAQLSSERTTSLGHDMEVDSVQPYASSVRRVTLLQQLVIKPSNLPLWGSKGHQIPKLLSAVQKILGHAMLDDTLPEKCFANLIRRGEILLAQGLSKYLPQSPLTSYLRGRLHLLLENNHDAATSFDEAAHSFSTPHAAQLDANSFDHLVSSEDVKDFYNGHARYYKHVADLYGREKQYSYAASFASKALQYIAGPSIQKNLDLHTELQSELFYASLKSSQFDAAYSALTQFPDKALQYDGIRRLITTLVDQSRIEKLLGFPFLGLQSQVDDALLAKCQTTLSLKIGPSYHKVLYAWRKSRGDFRGAAAILHELLCRLKINASPELLQVYVLLINTLMAVEPDQAWLLSESAAHSGDDSEVFGKKIGLGRKGNQTRKLITLDDIKRDYNRELDRVAMIESGDFPFVESDDDGEAIL